MNQHLIDTIETLRKSEYLVLQFRKNWKNSLLYLPNLAWGLLIGCLFAYVTGFSVILISILVAVTYMLTTGFKTVAVPTLHLRIVDKQDFNSFPLTNSEKVLVGNAQKRHITYDEFLKEIAH